MPLAAATATASCTQARAMLQAHSSARTCPTRMPVTVQIALKATFATSLLHTTGQRSS